MKRAMLIAMLFVAANALAADKWWDSYNKGAAAVNGGSYALAANLLAKAIAENPSESTGVRAGNAIITYVPHFYLGIAKFNLGDTDGALREWKISEDQGAVQRTPYYSKLKDWVARAQTEKQRAAQSAVSGPKKAAEAALSRAVQVQGDALSAGGDRTESYRDAQRKLQNALAQFAKAGTDASAYDAAAQLADQAAQRFSVAADEGKKLRAAAASRPKPMPVAPVVVTNTAPSPAPVVITNTAPPPPPVTVISQAKVAAELAVQEYRRAVGEALRNSRGEAQNFLRRETREGERLRSQLAFAKNDDDYDKVRVETEGRATAMAKKLAELAAPPPAVVQTTAVAAKIDLAPAYHAFATGDLPRAEQMLTATLGTTPAAEAYLLRGCVRYTRAMLSRSPDALLLAATDDFKAALQRNRALRLDPGLFSPKLVSRLEEVRSGR
jgi:tetratricopeptide (TPR) repeat protein